MAPRRGNFFIPSAGAFLWSATFIILSGVVLAERQCYWCGPLAEQVHRSRRAPPCDAPSDLVTTCEPGLEYCAVVATSPPYVESRLCVKLYQDECYPLFCNSTKTWKMTCPCRDDLCNGNNTDRENQAFAMLDKLVTKSQNGRIKKREISSPSFISLKRERTVIITNISEVNLTAQEETNDINQDDQMIIVTSTSKLDQNKPTRIEVKENTDTDVTTPEVDQDESTENPISEETTESNDREVNVTDFSSTNSITEISTKKETESTTPQTMTSKADITENLTYDYSMKSREQLPTAEALQQNVSPSITTTKTTQSIKMDSTDISTHGLQETTVVPTEGGENFATRFSLNTHVLLTIMFTVFISNY